MKKYIIAFGLFLFLAGTIRPHGWQWINTGYNFILFDISFPAGQSNIGYAVGSDVTYEGNGVILKTTDNGLTWSQISSGTIPGLQSVYFTSVDTGYAAGWQDYFIKTTDGGASWTQKNVDPNVWYFLNIEFWDSNHGIAAAAGAELFATTDAGETWTAATGMTQDIQDVCYAGSNTLYAVGGDEKISKSTDGGFSWTQIYSGTFQSYLLGVNFLNPNFGIVGGDNAKVMITTDGGTNWTTTYAGPYALYHGTCIRDMNTMYVAGTPEQVYKSTDGGSTWVSDFTGANNVALYKVRFTENGTGFISGSQGMILRNTDYTTPVELTSFTANNSGNDVDLNWNTATETNNSGFDVERKSGKSDWQKITFISGYGTSSGKNSYSYIDNNLNAGLYYYRLKQIDFDGKFTYSQSVEVKVQSPENFSLEQNYPNPFNPTTTILYSVPKESNVNITVFNSLGQKVTALVDGLQQAGNHQVVFNGSDLASGLYFVRMQAGNYNSTIKISLMK
jgi:photosystem II stability/assembly factor-like uncharacterized protein